MGSRHKTFQLLSPSSVVRVRNSDYLRGGIGVWYSSGISVGGAVHHLWYRSWGGSWVSFGLGGGESDSHKGEESHYLSIQ